LISENTKIKIIPTKINDLPCVFYEGQSWPLTLRTLQNNLLRKILGSERKYREAGKIV